MELKRCANCANGQWTNRESQVPKICITCHYNVEGSPSAWKPIVFTNADRIRAMSDEELAKYIFEIGWDCHLCAEYERLENEPLLRIEKCDEKCVKHCLDWLQQPVEVE